MAVHQRVTVILPMDKATVVVPTTHYTGPREDALINPVEPVPEIVLKHRDGELHRLDTSIGDARDAIIERRDEMAVTWFEQVPYMMGNAIAKLTDLQAFGFRRDREPATLLDNEPIGEFELVEIEPLNLGGLLIDSDSQLPLVLHRRDLTLWRLQKIEEGIPEEMSESTVRDFAFSIERRSHGEASWESVEILHPDFSVPEAAAKFADHVGVETLTDDVSSAAIEDALDKHVFWFDDAAENEEEQLFRDVSRIQDNTVLFEDEVPEDYSFEE